MEHCASIQIPDVIQLQRQIPHQREPNGHGYQSWYHKNNQLVIC
jgi:hypothetical protein